MATCSRLDSHPARPRRRTTCPTRLRFYLPPNHHAQPARPRARPRSRCRSLAARRIHWHAIHAMKVHVELPESLAAQARDLAAREHTTVDALIASSLAATL